MVFKHLTLLVALGISSTTGLSNKPYTHNLGVGSEFVDQAKTTCVEYTDCFSCTVVNCAWNINNDDKCGDLENAGASPGSPSFGVMRDHGSKCGDPLNLCYNSFNTQDNCGSDCTEINQKYDQQQYSYSSKQLGTTVPRGYFCLYQFTNNNEYLPITYWNRSESAQEDDNEFIFYRTNFNLANNEEGDDQLGEQYKRNSDMTKAQANKLGVYALPM